MRDLYSKSAENAQRNMTEEILSMEKALEQLQSNIPELEVQARNQEVPD
jgi:SMC interacting uncharacterized protein involved in chromosome segregation